MSSVSVSCYIAYVLTDCHQDVPDKFVSLTAPSPPQSDLKIGPVTLVSDYCMSI